MSDTRHKDPRPGQHFAFNPTSTPEASHEDPRSGERFSAESQSEPLAEAPTSEESERTLEAGLVPPGKRRWGLLVLLAGGIGLGTMEAGRTLYTAALGGHWASAGWSLLLLFALGLGGTALIRELFRLRRLKRHDILRDALATLPDAGPDQALSLARRLKRSLDLDDDDPHWQSFLAAQESHHDGRDIRMLLAHHVLSPRDQEARRLVSRMSGETAVMVAVSPLTLVDMLLVAWRNLAMIDRLCRLYGLELGYASRLRLLKSVLHNMAFAGATEIASEAGMEILSMNLAARLSTRAGQGLGIGLLSARLGLRTLRMARPLPFREGEAPHMSDLRSELWQQLRRLETPENRQDKPN